MKVKELRGWLADFGEKNKQHATRFSRREKVYTEGTVLGDKVVGHTPTNPTCLVQSPSLAVEQDVSQQGTDCSDHNHTSLTLGASARSPARSPARSTASTVSQSSNRSSADDLKQIPSADPTASTVEETVRDDDDLQQNTTESWDTNNCDSFEEFTDPSFSTPSPSFENSDSCAESTFGNESPASGDKAFLGHEHLELLRNQAKSKVQIESNAGSGHQEGTGRPSTSMHNAKIFGSDTLTSTTLDLICASDDSKPSSQLSAIDSVGSSKSAVSSNTSYSSSATQKSGASSSKPSIAPTVHASRIGRALLGEAVGPSSDDVWPPKEISGDYKVASAPSAPVRRKKVDPKQLGFLQPKKSEPKVFHELDLRPRTPVSIGIHKFGGPRQKIVDRRKEELEKKRAEQRKAVHVKKTKWDVCQKTGMYKKKVVIDVQYNTA